MTVYVSPKQYPFYFHKGRLCQQSSFFEKAFHGSFEEATTGSIYLEEDGVDEFKLFEEWLYTEKLSYPEDSDNPSLLLVKVFCFAERVGISSLQNATLDTIRDRATGQLVSLATPFTTYESHAIPLNLLGSVRPPIFEFQKYAPTTISPAPEKPATRYLPPATSSAIYYAYQNTLEGSSLRKLLADIFAFNVKPETLDEEILSLPHEFMADVLVINMKRLPLRLKDEKADFDKNADKYHVHRMCHDRKPRVFQDLERDATKADVDWCDGPTDEAAAEAAVDNVDDSWGFGTLKPSSSKGKKKGSKRST